MSKEDIDGDIEDAKGIIIDGFEDFEINVVATKMPANLDLGINKDRRDIISKKLGCT